jgi:hypothetical protein
MLTAGWHARLQAGAAVAAIVELYRRAPDRTGQEAGGLQPNS